MSTSHYLKKSEKTSSRGEGPRGKGQRSQGKTSSPQIERYMVKDISESVEDGPLRSEPKKDSRCQHSEEVEHWSGSVEGRDCSDVKVNPKARFRKGDVRRPVKKSEGDATGRSKPSSSSLGRAGQGGERRRRKKKVVVSALQEESGDEYTPAPRRRQVQQSIKDHFPVRRSTRRCKTALESEEFERTAERLRTKDETDLEVIEVEGKGRGVVSARPFKRGELICEYSGELISYDEAKRREADYSRDESIGCYMYYFDHKSKKLCVDATKDNGRLGRLLNHSKMAANVVTKLLEVDGHPYLCLMAARDIRRGEQLEYDYGERSSEALQSHPWLAS